jgi:multiple sugar transport system substrate-binding protein
MMTHDRARKRPSTYDLEAGVFECRGYLRKAIARRRRLRLSYVDGVSFQSGRSIALCESQPGFGQAGGPTPPDLKLAAAAIEKMQSAKDALPALLSIGLGQRGGEFDKVFMDTFQLVVLRGRNPRAVLDREAETLNGLMSETGAPCWQPDPPSSDACQVQ